jgi:membrane protease YdiL (CAAX protease family)
MLIVFLFVGWSEELLSRGFHLRLISKGLNRPLGIILSAFIFSYLHRNNPDITLGGLVFIFLFGIVFAFAFLRTGQLWLAIGLHAGWDFFVVVFWGTPISDLNVFHLMNINFNAFPFSGFLLEIFELCIVAVCIYFYTSPRHVKLVDW